MFLKNVLIELGFKVKIRIYNNNQSAQQLASNNMFHARSKHIDLRYNFIRDALHSKHFELSYLPTDEMMADVMTKPLGKTKHQYCIDNISIKSISSHD